MNDQSHDNALAHSQPKPIKLSAWKPCILNNDCDESKLLHGSRRPIPLLTASALDSPMVACRPACAAPMLACSCLFSPSSQQAGAHAQSDCFVASFGAPPGTATITNRYISIQFSLEQSTTRGRRCRPRAAGGGPGPGEGALRSGTGALAPRGPCYRCGLQRGERSPNRCDTVAIGELAWGDGPGRPAGGEGGLRSLGLVRLGTGSKQPGGKAGATHLLRRGVGSPLLAQGEDPGCQEAE